MPSRKTFDALQYAGLLAEIPTLIGPTVMREAMGAGKAELKSLERDVVLIPRTRLAKIKFPWRVSDGLDLVAELRARTRQTVSDDDAWESIQHASARSKLFVGEIVAAIRSGPLAVAVEKGVSVIPASAFGAGRSTPLLLR